ncbi:hypothetical protein ACFQL4_23755 [Halosimplex aquaticum]
MEDRDVPRDPIERRQVDDQFPEDVADRGVSEPAEYLPLAEPEVVAECLCSVVCSSVVELTTNPPKRRA